MRGNPDGSLSSTVRLAPQGLLTFRYIDGILEVILPATLGGVRDKVAAGVYPAARCDAGSVLSFLSIPLK